MSSAPSNSVDSHSPPISHNGGPQAHEDLNIRDLLKLMRVEHEDRESCECYARENGEKCWVLESHVSSFLREHGADHPNDYQSVHGSAWEKDFFKDL